MKMLVKILRWFAPVARRPFYAPIAVGAIGLWFLSLPAGAANLRQLPNLPVIPPSITFPAERDVLKTDLNRLAERRKALGHSRTVYDRECAHRMPFNPSSRRHCSSRLQELRRESSRLRTEIAALRQRFQTVEENALRRRGNGPRYRETVAAASVGGRPDARLTLIRQALFQNTGGWRDVLAHLKVETGKGAGNPALRDAFAYLNGMYEGQIAADHLDNVYYRHGVRRWLARDHWTAALSFARAARDHPDDRRVFASFADSAGRQHASPACKKARRCVSGDVSAWVKRFGKPHAHAMKKMLNGIRKMSPSEEVVSLRDMLGAIAIFAEKTDPGTVSAQVTDRIAMAALSKARDHDYSAALTGYIDLWRHLADGPVTARANLFFARYADASGDREGMAFLDESVALSTMGTIGEDYLEHLRRALALGRGNPFSGALTQAQIIRLQR